MDLQKLLPQLSKHEGTRKFPYVDTVGKLTIGVGHNLTDKGLTSAQIQSILIDDIKETIVFLDKNLPWWSDLDDVRQRALVDIAFNLMGKLLGFHQTLSYLQAKEWDLAADALLASLFAKQVGQRAVDLAFMIRTGADPL